MTREEHNAYKREWYRRDQERRKAEDPEAYKVLMAARRERIRENARRRKAENPGQTLAYDRQWREQHPERIRMYRQKEIGVSRVRKVKTKYGISLTDVDSMFLKQGGMCALCGDRIKRGTPEEWKTGKRNQIMVIDHDHRTGKVRGLLHNRCNIALGFLNDDPTMADRAAAYLRKHVDSEHAPEARESAGIGKRVPR